MDDSIHSGVGIRITSDPDTTRIERAAPESARRRVRLPLRMMLAADLVPGYDGPPFHNVAPTSFGDVMASLSPHLRIEVENRIGAEPARMDVELAFRSMGDFRPEQIARRIPAVAALLVVRTALDDLGAGRIDATVFRERLDEAGIDRDWTRSILRTLSEPDRPARPAPAAARTASANDPIDRLLGMVDVPGAPSEASGETPAAGSSGLFEALLHAATGSRESASMPVDEASALAAELDDSIGRQVLAVLEHPDFRRLEAAWRGLRFLIEHIDFRRDVVLDVLPVDRDRLGEAVYTHVLLPEHRGAEGRPPLTVLLAGFDFDASAADVALLADLAETGASLQIPVLASAAPSFFGVATGRGLEQLPPLRQHLDAPAWIAWNKLRARDEALNLAVAIPGVLARRRYGADDPVQGFILVEHDDLWMGGAFVVATAIAHSFAATEWPTRIRGTDAGVDSLPLRRDSRGAVPLAAVLSDDRQADFAEAGFVVVGCRPNRDAAFVVHAPTIYRPQHYDDPASSAEARVHASLPSRLFMARAAQILLAFQKEIAADADVESVRNELQSRLHTLLGQEEGVAVESVGGGQLAIRLRPPAAILDEPVSLVLGLQTTRAD